MSWPSVRRLHHLMEALIMIHYSTIFPWMSILALKINEWTSLVPLHYMRMSWQIVRLILVIASVTIFILIDWLIQPRTIIVSFRYLYYLTSRVFALRLSNLNNLGTSFVPTVFLWYIKFRHLIFTFNFFISKNLVGFFIVFSWIKVAQLIIDRK